MSERDPQLEVAAPQLDATPAVAPSQVAAAPAESPVLATKADVVAQLQSLLQAENLADRSETERLRVLFYRLHNEALAAAKSAFVEAGGEAMDFAPQPDALEEEFKHLMAEVKRRRAQAVADLERERQTNLERKLAIIEAIKALVAQPDEVEHNYDHFKELQAEWKTLGMIPAEHVTETWKNYHHHVEQFYDLLRINHEMRAYDFKKNLELKTQLCEAVEKLANYDDVVSAFHQLQKFHQEFREIGPVEKELREEVWKRFKAASTAVNKRHQDHFLALKAEEEQNLAQKIALCEQVEQMSFDQLKTIQQWEEMAQGIIALQAEWKSIGFAPRKLNQEVFERFRAACDRFFQAKTSHFQQLRANLSANLSQKKALCEQAEALQESTDWSATSQRLVALQAEWKKVGPVPHKVSDAIWTRFNTACNTFFERKKAATAGDREQEVQNLQRKQDIIARLQRLAAEGSAQLHADVKALQAEWSEVGHVPFRKKEKVYRAYREVCDQLYATIHQEAGQRRIDNLVRRAAESGNERQRLQRVYDEKKAEIQNYETNLTFLTAKSKSGNSLVADIERRIAQLKQELEMLATKMQELPS